LHAGKGLLLLTVVSLLWSYQVARSRAGGAVTSRVPHGPALRRRLTSRGHSLSADLVSKAGYRWARSYVESDGVPASAGSRR
jgi:hypothetical protein